MQNTKIYARVYNKTVEALTNEITEIKWKLMESEFPLERFNDFKFIFCSAELSNVLVSALIICLRPFVWQFLFKIFEASS